MKKIALSSLLFLSLCACSSNEVQVESNKETYTFNKVCMPYVGMTSYIPLDQRSSSQSMKDLESCEYEAEYDGNTLVLNLDEDEKESLMKHNEELMHSAIVYYQENVNASFDVKYNDTYRNIIFSMDSYEFNTDHSRDAMEESLMETGPLFDVLNLVSMNGVLNENEDRYINIEVINSTNGNHAVECLFPAQNFTMTMEDWECSQTMDHKSNVTYDEANWIEGEFEKIENDCLYFTVTDSNVFDKGWTFYIALDEIFVPYTYEGMKVSIRKVGEDIELTKENKGEDGKYRIDPSKPQKISDIVYYYGE